MVDDGRLSAHLEAAYGIQVAGLTRLDTTVHRVDRRDGPAWVARTFPPQRPAQAVAGDADILRSLERAGFPAERCAHADPVSTMDEQTVLVTEFVHGGRPPERARTYAILGALLGRLHARTAETVRPGGAWHHLVPQGTLSDEKAAALALVTAASGEGALAEAVAGVDDCADLPQAFVHPDFVTANAIATDEGLVIVDWAGAGRGPRLWSLGFLLWAAGARDLRLVDWVASRYARHTRLEPAELERLPGAVRARALMIDCWSVGHGYKPAARVVRELAADRALATRIADRARTALADAVEPP